MKVTTLFFVILTVLIAYTQAQCRKPARQICSGRRDEGRSGRGCRNANAFWYNALQRRCIRFRYRGCGGNDNRYCSLSECRRRCVRR